MSRDEKTTIDEVKRAQERERGMLLDKIVEGVDRAIAKNTEPHLAAEKAMRAVEMLAQRHRRQIFAYYDDEGKGAETDYKLRRRKALNGESWIGRGAARNALSRDLAQEMREMRGDRLRRKEADLAWLRESVDGMSKAVGNAATPSVFVPPSPGTPAQRDEGRAWLTGKCAIPEDILDLAEESGFLDYGAREVRFIGRDVEGRVRSLEVMSIDDPSPVGGAPLAAVRTKGDAAFPAVLPGEGASNAIVAHGGVNALAIAALAREAGEKIPAIISTGRAYARQWVDELKSQAARTIRAATSVAVIADNGDGPAAPHATAGGASKDGGARTDVSSAGGVLNDDEPSEDAAGRAEAFNGEILDADFDPELERLEMILRIARATGRDPDVLYTPQGDDAAEYWLKGGSAPASSWSDQPPENRGLPPDPRADAPAP